MTNRTGHTREDWLETGMSALSEDGFRALTITGLARRLGVTKGSFYWHFPSLGAYHERLLEHWMSWDTTETAREAKHSEVPLLRLDQLIEQRSLMQITDAVHEWAEHNEQAARAARRVETMRLRRVKEMLLQLGYDDGTATRRAQVIVWIGSRSDGTPIEWRHQVLKEIVEMVLASAPRGYGSGIPDAN